MRTYSVAPQTSKLVPVGQVLVLVSLGSSFVWRIAQRLEEGTLRGLAFIFTDLLRLAFFVGVTCWIIGALRNRRWKKEAQRHPPPLEK